MTFSKKWDGEDNIFSYGGVEVGTASPAHDVVSIGGVELPNSTFFVANALQADWMGGVLGLSYRADQQMVRKYGAYPTVLDNLRRIRAIRSRAFSIYLNAIGQLPSSYEDIVSLEKMLNFSSFQVSPAP